MINFDATFERKESRSAAGRDSRRSGGGWISNEIAAQTGNSIDLPKSMVKTKLTEINTDEK
jgi:hypothetical protein